MSNDSGDVTQKIDAHRGRVNLYLSRAVAIAAALITRFTAIDWRAPLAPYKPDQPLAQPSLRTWAVRALVAFVTGAWMTFFPIYLFVIYMLHEKFFSYEFFSEGVFGLKTFLFVMFILMVVLAIYMWGFILTAKLGRIQHSKTGQYGSYRWLTYGLFGASVLFHFVLYDIGWRTDNLSRLPVVSVFGFVLMFAMSSFVGVNMIHKLSNWMPSAVFILASATIPVLDQEMTADLVGLGLANFNVGGGVTARVVRLDGTGTVVYDGKLLLLTPRNAYFREGKRGYRVIRQSDSVSVSVGKG